MLVLGLRLVVCLFSPLQATLADIVTTSDNGDGLAGTVLAWPAEARDAAICGPFRSRRVMVNIACRNHSAMTTAGEMRAKQERVWQDQEVVTVCDPSNTCRTSSDADLGRACEAQTTKAERLREIVACPNYQSFRN